MKKILKSALFLALFGTIFIGCEQEDSVQPNSSSDLETPSNKGVLNSKTTYSEFEYAAMAANISSITHASGDYVIAFYDGTSNHTVSITSFDEDSLIEYDVTNGATTTYIEIDVINEGIDIQTIGIFTFAAYEGYSITSSDPTLKNIMPVITAHHMMNAGTTTTFDDNGTGDDFIPDADPSKRRFFGPKTTLSLCVATSRQECKNFYVLWNRVYHECESVPC